MPDENGRADGRNQESGKSREARCDGSRGTRFAHRRVRPAEKEAPNRAEASRQIGILAAGLRHCGAEFREGKRPKQRKHSSNDPRGIDHADRAAHGGHFARLQENPRPDNGADNNSHRGPWTESSNQLNPLFAHQASLASLGCALSPSSCPNPAMRLTTAPAMYVVPEPINTYQA